MSDYKEGQNEYKPGFWPALGIFAVSGIGLALAEAARQAALNPEPKFIITTEIGLGLFAIASAYKMVKNTIAH